MERLALLQRDLDPKEVGFKDRSTCGHVRIICCLKRPTFVSAAGLAAPIGGQTDMQLFASLMLPGVPLDSPSK